MGVLLSFQPGEGEEDHIHHQRSGVRWRLWNTWREILVVHEAATLASKERKRWRQWRLNLGLLLPDYRTRYNKPCKDGCEGRGEDFFWCNTIDRDHTIPYNWDYCSPKAMEPVIARGGRPCVGICDTMGKSYKWCNVWNAGYSGDSWDYCGEGGTEAEAAW